MNGSLYGFMINNFRCKLINVAFVFFKIPLHLGGRESICLMLFFWMLSSMCMLFVESLLGSSWLSTQFKQSRNYNLVFIVYLHQPW